MGSCSVLEYSAIAAATQGCASCSSAARPAARNSADSRLIFQLTELGPKIPSEAPAAEFFTSSSRRSRSAAETGWGSRVDICLYGSSRPRDLLARICTLTDRYMGSAREFEEECILSGVRNTTNSVLVATNRCAFSNR